MPNNSRKLTRAAAYNILGVTKDAPLEELTAAYRRFVKSYHPDCNQGDVDKEKVLKEVNAIYPELITSARRTEAEDKGGGTTAGRRASGRSVYDQDMEESDKGEPYKEKSDKMAGDKGDGSSDRQASPSYQATSQPPGGDAKFTYAHPNENTATATSPKVNFADLMRKGNKYRDISSDYAIALYSLAATVADEGGFKNDANSARRKIIVLSLERADEQNHNGQRADAWVSYLMSIRTAEKYEPAAGFEDSDLKSSIISACLKSADIAESPIEKLDLYRKAVEVAERYGLTSTAMDIKDTTLSFCMTFGDENAGKGAMEWYEYGKKLSEEYGNVGMTREFGRRIRLIQEAEENPFVYIPRR